MQALLKSLQGAKGLGSQLVNVLKGGKEIAVGGAGKLMPQGGKSEALKRLLMANKGGTAALGGAGAAGLGGAGYAAAEAMDDEEDDLLERLGLK